MRTNSGLTPLTSDDVEAVQRVETDADEGRDWVVAPLWTTGEEEGKRAGEEGE